MHAYINLADHEANSLLIKFYNQVSRKPQDQVVLSSRLQHATKKKHIHTNGKTTNCKAQIKKEKHIRQNQN